MSATSAIYSVTVNWGAVSGATGYRIKLGSTEYNVSGTSATISGLKSKTSYSYQMCCKNADGIGSYGSAKTIQTLPALPAVPRNITKKSTENTATITWSPASGATSYDILFNGSVSNVTTTTKTFTGLSANRSYSLKYVPKMRTASANMQQQ